MDFPIKLEDYENLNLSLNREISDFEVDTLTKNISLVRDSVVFMTAYSNLKSLGGHTGGPYDIVPEMVITHSLAQNSDTIYKTFFEDAGHRVAVHYVMACIDKKIPINDLLKYREYDGKLPGHPERGDDSCVDFASGRLGHTWSFVNGVAMANPEKCVVMFSSDGAMQEGNNAEAARFCVANKLNVKVLIDDNDMTIVGAPSKYLEGYNLSNMFKGFGIEVFECDGEDYKKLYQQIMDVFNFKGPAVLLIKRIIAPGIKNLEGTPKAHDCISIDLAKSYLSTKGFTDAINILSEKKTISGKKNFEGCSEIYSKNRDDFGKIITKILGELPLEDRKNNIVIDCDLEGSCGLHHIKKNFPQIFVNGGIMERNNVLAAAGFGSIPKNQGITGTFSAFCEMVVSEINVARLNKARLLVHFSHAGVDEIADNTSHHGINIFFTDPSVIEDDCIKLYFPADTFQMNAVVRKIFDDKNIRVIFSTRSETPAILNEEGKHFFEENYEFTPGKDEIIRKGESYVISYGEMLHKCLDVIEKLRKEGLDIGLINKPSLNIIDEEMMEELKKAKSVIVIESQNSKTGLGIRFGTWLLERGFKGRYAHAGTVRPGIGGLKEQLSHQGLHEKEIKAKIMWMIR